MRPPAESLAACNSQVKDGGTRESHGREKEKCGQKLQSETDESECRMRKGEERKEREKSILNLTFTLFGPQTPQKKKPFTGSAYLIRMPDDEAAS